MDWSTEVDDEMEIDWVKEETQEHAFLTVMMEKLEMEFEMSTCMEVVLDDSIDEELEYTILDEILQEWCADDQMVEGVVEEVAVQEAGQSVDGLELEKDECLKSFFCKGDCQSISQLSCKASAE